MIRYFFALICIGVSLNSVAQIEWSSELTNCYSFSSPRCVDLNGDGVRDVILGAGIDGEAVDNGIIALSGVNGNVLWSIPTPDQIFGSASFLDINNDNVPDVIIGGRSSLLYAINGSTGDIIWEFFTDSTPPGDSGYWNFYNAQIIPDQNNDSKDDILVSNGGDHSLPIFETDRPPGHIMVISGLDGAELAYAQVPDGKETYMSPIVADFQNNGTLEVIFGTGGEQIDGKLFRCTLAEVMANDLSGATELLSSDENGFIAPPSLVDINLDGTTDIIVNAYDGRVVALNGLDNSTIWNRPVPGSETNSSPAIGFFNGDNIPDVFSTYAVGVAPGFSSFIQMMIDGSTGEILWEDDLGIFHFSSPLVYDLDGDGVDEVIQSINEQVDGNFSNSILSIDFNVDEGEPATQILVGPNDGVNINATPWIGNVDEDGIMDLVSLRSVGTTFATLEDGIFVEKYSLEGIADSELIPWGAYLGTNGDGFYTSTEVECTFELSFSSNNNDCYAGNSGLAAVSSTGCPNMNDCDFLWDNGSTEPLVSNLAAGDYSVQVTHPNGCVLQGSVSISEPSTAAFFLTSTNATCDNTLDGGIIIENLDPTFNYNFSWSNGSSGAILEDAAPGEYTVFFTDQNGCFVELTTEIMSSPPISFEVDFQNISCNGELDASTSISGLAGAEPIQVLWTGDFEGQDILTLDGLTTGTYNLEIVDANNCNVVESYTVTEPEELEMSIQIESVTCTGNNDGTVTVDIIGGTSPYTIAWDQNFVGPTFSQLFVRGNLSTGDYNLEITDWNNCSVSATVPIIGLSLNTTINSASGFGIADGSITFQVSNGQSPYSVSVGGVTYNSFPQTIAAAGGDEVAFEISDTAGCIYTENVTMPFGQGINDLVVENIVLHPNPVFDQVRVNLPDDLSCMDYSLYDFTGKLVKEGSLNGDRLDMSASRSGVYLVVIQCQKRVFSGKVVKL